MQSAEIVIGEKNEGIWEEKNSAFSLWTESSISVAGIPGPEAAGLLHRSQHC